MSKAYKTGYESGYGDASNGRGKNYRSMGKGVLTFNFDRYSSEYVKGYDAGYTQALKDNRRS